MALPAGRPARLGYYWVENPKTDILASAALAVAITLVSAWCDWGQIIASADAGTRRALFQVIAGFAGTLLGLTLASLSILVGLVRSPVAQLDAGLSGHGQVQMVKTFVWALAELSTVFLLSLWAILNNTADNTAGSNVVQVVVLAGLVLAALGISRVIWILWKLLQITAHGTPKREETDE
jgi:hypothetical protein